MIDSAHLLVQIGRSLLDADARASSTLINRAIDPIEAEFRSTRIKSLADKIAASALEGLIDLGPDQAAGLRSLAQLCWIIEDKLKDPYMAGRWHDLGQLLWQAAHGLTALIEEQENVSA